VNLTESARQWVLAKLPYDRRDAALVAYLNGLDAHGLLVVWHNWTSRLVQPQPWTVHKSQAFQQNQVTTQRAGELSLLIDDIEQGRDLTKYLSRDIARAPAKVPGAKRRPDLDMMLNDWGVHHLHISSTVEADGFVKRDGPLLFVSFTPDAAYLIDIMTHGDWTRDHVLAVLADEWPNAGVIHKIPNLTSNIRVTEEQRSNLRKNRYVAAFEHNGSVYMPAGGMMADGTTIVAWAETRHLLGRIEALEKALVNNPRCLTSDFERSGLVFPNKPEFQFAIREDGAGIIEPRNGS